MTPTPCRVAGCIPLSGLYAFLPAPAHLLTYLHSRLCAYKTVNISETVDDRAKVTMNGQYKLGYGLSIAAKMYDLV